MTRIWIHLIICSNTQFLLEEKVSWSSAKAEIIKVALQENIVINTINGALNHLHFIIWLGEKQTVNDIIDQLKRISTDSLLNQKLIDIHFRWIDDYLAFSVSDLLLELEKHCIMTQPKYHQTKEFKDEISFIFNECKINYE